MWVPQSSPCPQGQYLEPAIKTDNNEERNGHKAANHFAALEELSSAGCSYVCT